MSSTDEWIASPEAEQLDARIAQYDCLATGAHVLMLASQGIMTRPDAAAALGALLEIEEICSKGQFRYMPGYGAQLTLEKMIVDRVGPEIGYQVHTGRSRNDQVMTAQKMCVKDLVLEVAEGLLQLISSLLERSGQQTMWVMPGYTHMQPARPTTLGQWFAAYADMFSRDFRRLQDSYIRNDTSPLGAAESHGTSWNLDREMTMNLLGFSALDEIPLDAVSSRGESEADLLGAVAFISLHLSKLAEDLLLFTTYEYGYASLGAGQATRMGKLTGSSIMPQKRNPDVLELLRGQASEINACLSHSLDTLTALPSGYNRDSRNSKAPAFKGLDSIAASLQQAALTVDHIEFDRQRMLEATVENHSMATDLAEHLAQEYKIPFRQMHSIVGKAVAEAIEQGRRVCDLTVKELEGQARQAGCELPLSDQDIAQGSDPQQAVRRRNNTGGSNSEQMEAWATRRQESFLEMSEWLKQQVGASISSKERLRSMSRSLA